MRFTITKSGLEVFDTCCAWGLVNLLDAAYGGRYQLTISDEGGWFVITMEMEAEDDLPDPDFQGSDKWRAIKKDDNWRNVLLTYTDKQVKTGREQVIKALENSFQEILQSRSIQAQFQGDKTLLGSLDPCAFKGLRGHTITHAYYNESQLKVDEKSWALACLGALLAQKYNRPRNVTRKEYYVILPVPDKVLFKNFLEIREVVDERTGLDYPGVRVAAAHYAVLLAEEVRKKKQSHPSEPADFSKLLYFSLFKSSQQLKPTAGGAVRVAPLIELANSSAAARLFETWNYLLYRSVRKNWDDLAHAVTELVLSPSRDTYYHHARILLRYVFGNKQGLDIEKLYSEESLMEVMKYVEG